MKYLHGMAAGEFEPRTLRIYLAAEALVFWGIIFLCWRLFPEANAFSIHTHTFSYLGSYEPDRNPGGWWLFTIAMVFWGLATIPIVRHNLRRLGGGEASGALRATRFLLIAGCAGIVIVGLFPDARGPLIGSLRWTDIHYLGALILVLGFIIGIPRFTLHLVRAARDPQRDPASRHRLRRALWPQYFFMAVSTIALTLLLAWVFVYEHRRAAAEAAGLDFGSPWREAMNTPYSFPLWDNVYVYTLFIYFAWTALALSGERRE